MLVAFLVLAALYESWLLPLAIVLIVPMCLLCAVAGLLITRLDLNIFSQIGLVVLVGLATKNAILIVEFAKQKREAGMPRHEAAVEAATQRLRPILMTSFAFILGRGAAADRRRGRGRDAEGAGHGGVQRDARGDRVRDLLHAGVLRGDPRLRDRGAAPVTAPSNVPTLIASPGSKAPNPAGFEEIHSVSARSHRELCPRHHSSRITCSRSVFSAFGPNSERSLATRISPNGEKRDYLVSSPSNRDSGSVASTVALAGANRP